MPRVLAAAAEGALVLEPLEGARLDRLPTGELGAALRALGAALAPLHGLPPRPPALRRGSIPSGSTAPPADRPRAPGRRAAAAELLARLLARAGDGAGGPSTCTATRTCATRCSTAGASR